jgi:hypothetical protein
MTWERLLRRLLMLVAITMAAAFIPPTLQRDVPVGSRILWLEVNGRYLHATLVSGMPPGTSQPLIIPEQWLTVMAVGHFLDGTITAWSLMVPWFWLVIGYGAVLATRKIIRNVIAARRRAQGCCGECGYNLTGNESGECPECGHSWE